MVLAKSKNSVGLGNSLMNDRFGKGKGVDRKRQGAVTRTNHATGEQYLVNEKQDAAWVKMRSVTQQGALDEFLATAELADTDFTAEKMNNVKIIHTDQRNPYLLSAQEERVALGKHKIHRNRLTVPRRPKWNAETTPKELDMAERDAFLDWRRGLADLQENNDLLMTPFERNLEVWRQLWRVIERSDLVVQIVDARNPLLFRSEDLESYVKAVDPKKENLLLINKADMMTLKQRQAWAKYLKTSKIAFKFFSAHLAKELNDARDNESDSDEASHQQKPPPPARQNLQRNVRDSDEEDEEDSEDNEPERGGARTDGDDTQILTVEELEDIFLQHAPNSAGGDQKLTVGLVGYPNVGKSSTINALIGAKKVSVSSTPGKTKHFQTIHLSDRVLLCDCPGLVFANFATTKADLVCNGILPIDQMRDYHGPVGLVTQRIPQWYLEAIYGIGIKTRPIEEGGTGEPTGEELLRAYARARGFFTQGLGQPDESRAARYVLKDYVNGKLLFVEPPPESEDGKAFNTELYAETSLPEKRRAALVAGTDRLNLTDTLSPDHVSSPALESHEDLTDSQSNTTYMLPSEQTAAPSGQKSQNLDKAFFGARSNGGHVTRPFNFKYTEQGIQQNDAGSLGDGTEIAGGKQLSGRKARTVVALENGLDPKDVQLTSGKKHFKGGPKMGKKKIRGIRTDDD